MIPRLSRGVSPAQPGLLQQGITTSPRRKAGRNHGGRKDAGLRPDERGGMRGTILERFNHGAPKSIHSRARRSPSFREQRTTMLHSDERKALRLSRRSRRIDQMARAGLQGDTMTHCKSLQQDWGAGTRQTDCKGWYKTRTHVRTGLRSNTQEDAVKTRRSTSRNPTPPAHVDHARTLTPRRYGTPTRLT